MRALRSFAGISLALSCAVFGCAAAETGDTLTGDDDDETGGSSGSGGSDATGGTGDTGGSSSATGGSGATATGGSTTGGTGSSTGGTSPTGGAGGTTVTPPPPPGRPTIPLPYTDDFETSEARDWRFISVPWTVMDDGGNRVLQLSGSGDSETTWAVGGDRNWTDVRVEMRVKFVSGEAMILLSPRWQNLDSYVFVEYEAEDKPKVRSRFNGSTTDIVTTEETMTFTAGQWHTIAVTLAGNVPTLEIDGVVVGTVLGPTSVPGGGIGIAVENGVVAIDDVSVTVP